LLNISRGGLAFKYINSDTPQADDASELVIFSSHREYVLKGVPCKTISNVKLVEDNPFSSISMRVCGIQFGMLTDKQKDLLNYFINNHTSIKKRAKRLPGLSDGKET